MRLLLPLVATVLAGVSASCGETAEIVAHERGVTVARVADGDSLVLADGRRLRLLQIDAPEVGEGECYAREAYKELARIVRPGARAILESDPRLDSRDRHGRLLRYIIVGTRNVNLVLVERGAAAPFFLRGDRGSYADELLEAVDEARSSRRGMWGACRVAWREDRLVETSRR